MMLVVNARKITVAACVALVGMLGVVGCSSDDQTSSTPDPTATTLPEIDGVESFTGLSRNHTSDDVDYPQSPPVGGDHDGAWQNCGVYDTPVRDENAVHSLEHGAVWLAYRPDLPADEVEVLRGLARNQTHILVSPYPDLTAPVVATAWGKQLRLESATDARLAAFVTKYQEGPDTPELGVTCGGSPVGEPIE
jgi:hypothetical protein